MKFQTYDDPASWQYRGNQASSIPRRIGKAMLCSLQHSWRHGVANNHLYSSSHRLAGQFLQCRTCGLRIFKAEDRAHFEEILEIERERWSHLHADPVPEGNMLRKKFSMGLYETR